MSNAYETAVSLGITGTDVEVIAALQAIPRHRKNVYITAGPADTESVNLLHLLTARHRVMGMGSAQQWVGPLIDLEGSNQQVAGIMSILRPMLQVNDTLVYCADSDDAANMLNALAAIVAQITGRPDQVAAEVTLLSGGRIGAEFANLTVEQFAAQRTASQALAAKQVALTRCDEASEAARAEYRSADSTPESIIAAAVAVLEA
jgi:hypothetical protein